MEHSELEILWKFSETSETIKRAHDTSRNLRKLPKEPNFETVIACI